MTWTFDLEFLYGHLKERPGFTIIVYKSKTCLISFLLLNIWLANADAGRYHIASKHKGIKYPCEKCEYAATTKASLRKHVASMHDTVRSVFKLNWIMLRVRIFFCVRLSHQCTIFSIVFCYNYVHYFRKVIWKIIVKIWNRFFLIIAIAITHAVVVYQVTIVAIVQCTWVVEEIVTYGNK